MENKQQFFYSVSEISELFTISKPTAMKLVKQSGCALRIGHSIRVDYDKFMAYIEQNYLIKQR